MSEANRRRAAIAALKQLGPAIEIGPSMNPEPAVAMTRHLHILFEAAKQQGDIDPAIKFLHSKIDATIHGMGQLGIACKRSCSHCCNIWVSAFAPELLFVAKLIRGRHDQTAERVRVAHEHTKDFGFDVRDKHPYPCPILQEDICSLYESRPSACRLAASADATVCERSYRHLANENIPVPAEYHWGRGVFATVLVVALKRSNLPFVAYDLNAGLTRALDVPNAEQSWLSGKDIFAGVMRESNVDFFSATQPQTLYKLAFGEGPT
jgi:Fe-S-cluster containining protein